MRTDCPICLEKNNANSSKFCCKLMHNKCILNLLKNNGKCAICKFEYPVYQENIKDTDTNPEQIRHRALEHVLEEYEMLLMTYREQIADISARVIMLENHIINNNN